MQNTTTEREMVQRRGEANGREHEKLEKKEYRTKIQREEKPMRSAVGE